MIKHPYSKKYEKVTIRRRTNLGFVTTRMELTDLPPEVLEMIFSYLQLNLQGLLELSMVCRLFRDVARRVPVPVKIPLQDSQLAVMQVIVLSFFKCYLEVSCIDHAVIAVS